MVSGVKSGENPNSLCNIYSQDIPKGRSRLVTAPLRFHFREARAFKLDFFLSRLPLIFSRHFQKFSIFLHSHLIICLKSAFLLCFLEFFSKRFSSFLKILFYDNFISYIYTFFSFCYSLLLLFDWFILLIFYCSKANSG